MKENSNLLFKTFEVDPATIKLEESPKSKYGVLKGYASIYNNIDMMGDRILRGCFEESIKENPHVPILKGHNWEMQIGYNYKAEDNSKGLKVVGLIDKENNQAAKETWSLCKMSLELGKPIGLSVGFQIIKADWSEDEPTIYEIMEARLFEYSVTPIPANQKAIISAVEEEKSIRQLGKDLKSDSMALLFLNRFENTGLKTREVLTRIDSFIDRDLLISHIKEMFSNTPFMNDSRVIDKLNLSKGQKEIKLDIFKKEKVFK